jgi:hypothetical protein
MSLRVEKGSAVNGCVKRIMQTVGCCTSGPGTQVQVHYFASTSGKPSDCSARLNQLLRGTLMLAEDVTGTSVRRAIVDNFNRTLRRPRTRSAVKCSVSDLHLLQQAVLHLLQQG